MIIMGDCNGQTENEYGTYGILLQSWGYGKEKEFYIQNDKTIGNSHYNHNTIQKIHLKLKRETW